MFFRERNGSIAIERATYTAAIANADGTTTPAKRSTEYVGSVRAHRRFNEVPGELLAKLNELERAELQERLKANEPRPLSTFGSLAMFTEMATRELKAAQEAGMLGDQQKVKDTLEKIKKAHAELLKAAQAAGLRRKVQRKKVAAKPAEPAEATPPAAS